jgi:hypothetical protein
MSKHLLLTAIAAAGVVIAAPAAAPGKSDLGGRTEARLPGLDLGAPATPGRRAVKAYGELPLAFVPNAGQSDRRVRFEARTGGTSFWFTRREAVFSFAAKGKGDVLRLQFVGANSAAEIGGQRPGPGRVNYLLGNDPSKWRTGLSTYREVVYRQLWPGIDMVFRGEQGRLKYEFRLAPGADPASIRLAYRGAERLALGPAGDLRIRTALGVLRDSRPASYQLVGGKRVAVASRYELAQDTYGFAVGAYDRGRPLVIDPGLVYSTYVGGSGSEGGLGIAVDALGYSYVTGFTDSTDFPTSAGASDTTFNGGSTDAFVTKMNAAGSGLVYSTYLGGSLPDEGDEIAIDAAGSAYVTGITQSADFPTMLAFQASHGGGVNDAFVAKLNPTGSGLVYSTYLGGTSYDIGHGIALDPAGSAYVTGSTLSSDFPTTAGASDTSVNGGGDAFVTKLNPAGSGLAFSTYLGGSQRDGGEGIALDLVGNVHVTGSTESGDFPTTAGASNTTFNGVDDAFVARLNAAGSGLVYSTYLGGSSNDEGSAIAVDAAGNAFVSGSTRSSDFPTTAGALDTSFNFGIDVFVTKLNATGSGLVYSTYLGGSQVDEGFGIAVDVAGNADVTGDTASPEFPTTQGAFTASHSDPGDFDAFVTKLNAAGSGLIYSTYLGGSNSEVGFGIAADAAGNAYVTGVTYSTDFPTRAGALDTSFNGGASDGFATKLDMIGTAATVVLSPAADTNPVGTSHTVTATVTDAGGSPVPNIVVRFSVSGSVNASGSCTTGTNGQCSFSYQGPQLPGADLIAAFADTNGNGTRDLVCPYLPCVTDPGATATKAWVLPTSTTGQASGGGQIQNAAGDKISFGFFAKGAGGLQGSCSVVEQGGRMIKCSTVTALVLSGNQATIYGNATDNGAATTYVIHAVDNADPGKGADTFSIQTASGYSASGTLTAGNVQVKP